MQKGVCQSTLSRYTLVHHTVATITDWLRGDYGNGEHELDGLSGASADTKGLLDGILHNLNTCRREISLHMNGLSDTVTMHELCMEHRHHASFSRWQAHRFKTGTKGTWRDVILALIPCYREKKQLFCFIFRIYAKWWPDDVLASIVQQNIECLMIIRGTSVVVEDHTLCRLYDIKHCSRTLCGPNHPLFFTHPSRMYTHTHRHTRAFKKITHNSHHTYSTLT